MPNRHLHHTYLRHHPRLRGVRGLRPATDFPAGSLSPAQVLTAYGFKQNQFAGAAPIKVGIGSLGGGVVQRDIDNEVAAWGMLPPKLTVRTVAGATNDPSDQDSNVENMLDIAMVAFAWWWLTGTSADITITFGPNASSGMQLVTEDLLSAGVEVGSWSWGSAATEWAASERSALSSVFASAVSRNVQFFAASGDSSIDDGTRAPSADYPCSDPNVWAVGGTSLTINADGTISVERAWGDGQAGDEGGGGGYDPTVPVPAWQRGVVPVGAPGRGVPDTAANADPNSGWQISANGSWTVVGGTSAASPFTAALVAVARGAARALGAGLVTEAIYAARATACSDVTVGSDGDAATPGWDPATGLGSPAGAGFSSAIVAWAGGAAPPAPPAPPPPPSPPQVIGVTAYQAMSWAAERVGSGWHKNITMAEAQNLAGKGIETRWPTGAKGVAGR